MDTTTTKTFEDGLRAAGAFPNKAVLAAAIADLRAQMPVVQFAPIPRTALRGDLEILYASACVALADELEARDAAAAACALVNGGGGLAVPEAQLEAESAAAWADVVATAPPEALAGPTFRSSKDHFADLLATVPAVSPPRPTKNRAVVVGTCPHVVDERAAAVAELEAVVNGRHADLTELLPRARQLLGRTDLVRKVEALFLVQLDVEEQRAKASALRARAQRRVFVPGGTASTAAALRRIDGERRAATGVKVGDLYPDLARRERRPAEL